MSVATTTYDPEVHALCRRWEPQLQPLFGASVVIEVVPSCYDALVVRWLSEQTPASGEMFVSCGGEDEPSPEALEAIRLALQRLGFPHS